MHISVRSKNFNSKSSQKELVVSLIEESDKHSSVKEEVEEEQKEVISFEMRN